MRDRSRESWCRDYMRLLDNEYDNLGFTNETDSCYAEYDHDEAIYPAAEYDEETEGFGMGSVWPEDLKEEPLHRRQKAKDDSVSALPGFIKLRDIDFPDEGTDKVKKLKRDLRMEALKRIEDAARTVADFNVLLDWYDKLAENERRRVGNHELLRSGDDLPLEYGENENGAAFASSSGSVIARQMRKGDFLDAIYYKPETIDQLVTKDYIVHFMRGIEPKYRYLFFYRVLEKMSNAEIAEMKGQTDRAVRESWNILNHHLKQRTMGVLIYRSDKDYSFTGAEQRFFDTCRDQYEFRIEPEVDS